MYRNGDNCSYICTIRVLNFEGYFCVFVWQENSWSVNFRGHGGMVGTIVVGFAKYASYCGLIFVDKRRTMKFMKIFIPQISTHTLCWINV